MTSAVFSGGWKQSRAPSTALPILPILAMTLLAVFAVSLPNLLDPMIRHDDFPALLGQPEWFQDKTLHEGRWVNYIWHFRGVLTPAWFNFAVYQALWAVVAATLAVAAMGRSQGQARHGWFAGLLALFILLAPPATQIVLWYNTLLPGLAFVALYTYLGCRLSQRWHRALLLPFTVVTLMAYTTYPLILLAACLFRTEHRSLRDLMGLLVLFVISFATAVLVTYAINWQVHGIFGVPPAVWREAAPASDLAGILANLPKLESVLLSMVVAISLESNALLTLHLMVFLVATLLLIRKAPMEALYLHAGLWIGIALTTVQVLKLGVHVPPRSFTFFWIFYAAIVVRAGVWLGDGQTPLDHLKRNLSLLVVVIYLPLTCWQFTSFHPWLAETRDFARAIEQTNATVMVHGKVKDLTSGVQAAVQDELALPFRIEALTGRHIVMCRTNPEACRLLERAATGENPRPVFTARIVQSDGKTRLVYSGS